MNAAKTKYRDIMSLWHLQSQCLTIRQFTAKIRWLRESRLGSKSDNTRVFLVRFYKLVSRLGLDCFLRREQEISRFYGEIQPGTWNTSRTEPLLLIPFRRKNPFQSYVKSLHRVRTSRSPFNYKKSLRAPLTRALKRAVATLSKTLNTVY
jgi:hypothetical protein